MALLPRCLFFLVLPGCLLPLAPCEVEDDDVNLLGGGAFEELTCWYDGADHTWVNSGIDQGEASPGSGAPVYVANNTVDGSDPASIQLMQGPEFSALRNASLGLEDGDEYEITFWAKADTPRSIHVAVSTPTSPWTNTEVLLDTTWVEQTVLGAVAAGEPDDAWVEFQLGGDEGQVWLDDIVMRTLD